MKNQDSVNPSPLLDYEQLQMLKEAGEAESSDLFTEILQLYEEESIQKVIELSKYSGAGDFENMGRAAHALAGSSANIGAREVWQLAKKIENLCKEGKGSEADELLTSLKGSHSQSLIALKAMIKT